jgi:hypothetical protein
MTTSSATNWLPGVETVGASFTGLTVTVKVRLLAPKAPSTTVRLIAAEPEALATGLTVTLRFVPERPNTIFALGIRAGLEEVASRVNAVAVVSASRIVNAIGPVEPSSAMA